MYHLLGDVPAPILIGKMMDIAIQKAGDDPEELYHAYKTTLQFTLSMSITIVRLTSVFPFSFSVFGWSHNWQVLSWGLGYLLIYRSKEYGPAFGKKSLQSTKGVEKEKGVIVVEEDGSQFPLMEDDGAKGAKDFNSSGFNPSLLEDDRVIIAVANGVLLKSVHSSIIIEDSDDEPEEVTQQKEQQQEEEFVLTQIDTLPAEKSTVISEVTIGV